MLEFFVGLILLLIWSVVLIFITPFAIIALFAYAIWALVTLIIDIVHEYI